jgi:broad specificity polyphosphatase/5'/3'-nucleotidase SurE
MSILPPIEYMISFTVGAMIQGVVFGVVALGVVLVSRAIRDWQVKRNSIRAAEMVQKLFDDAKRDEESRGADAEGVEVPAPGETH